MPSERVMEHTESVKSMAVERYLSGEMPDEERNAFEEHFFACVKCGDDVHAGTAIVAGVRTRDWGKDSQRWPLPQPQPRPWLARMSIAAAAAFAILSGYQGWRVIPQLTGQVAAIQQERDYALDPALQRLSLSTSVSRGETDNRVSAGQPFVLDVDIEPQNGATGYVLEIIDAGGVSRAKRHVTRDEAIKSVPVMPRGGKLPPGHYYLKVSPEAAGRPSSRLFEVQ